MPQTPIHSPILRRLQLLSCYLNRSLVCPGPPPTVIIATTHRCNMGCKMCIRAVRKFDGSNMDESLFRKIVDDGDPYLRYISLDGPGETLMNPEAFRMIRYAKSKGVRVMFSTNAALLDECKTEEILNSGLDLITFSVNAVTPDVYEKIHGSPCYEKVTANIHNFLKAKSKRRAKILVIMQIIRLPETLSQLGSFYRIWRQVPGVNLVRVKNDVLRNEVTWQREPGSRPLFTNPCPRLWEGPPLIETNGDVYASAGVLYKTGPVGNVTQNSLGEIWNCGQMRSLRLAHITGNISDHPECLDCCYPQPRLPLIVSGFLLDPFIVGKLIPLAERLAFRRGLPLYEKTGRNDKAIA
jgi:MoaA/NifB/PqqE/SkfB family radical SAM enzyme